MPDELTIVYDKPEFKVYKGIEFLGLNLKPRDWIIEGIIKEGDSVLLCGNAKSGKSIITQQMIFSFTTGTDFLNEFVVRKKYRTMYVMLEGDLADMQERYKRMMKGLPLDQDNFTLYFCEPLSLANPETLKAFLDKISEFKPEILIIDPIYMACLGGSLSDDSIVRDFIGGLRLIKQKLECTIITIHHTHKQKWSSMNGDSIDEGDDAFFGSAFFKAWPDHLLMLHYEKRSDLRHLTCSTQRSNEIEHEIVLKLNQDPLYFEESKEILPGTVINISKKRIVEILEEFGHPMRCPDVYKKLEMKKSTFHVCKDALVKEGICIVDGKGRTMNIFLGNLIGASHKKPEKIV